MDAAQGRCPFTFHFTTNILPYIFNFGRYPFSLETPFVVDLLLLPMF
jgi:hypothetical protein